MNIMGFWDLVLFVSEVLAASIFRVEEETVWGKEDTSTGSGAVSSQ
jgi:hypothetical protein